MISFQLQRNLPLQEAKCKYWHFVHRALLLASLPHCNLGITIRLLLDLACVLEWVPCAARVMKQVVRDLATDGARSGHPFSACSESSVEQMHTGAGTTCSMVLEQLEQMLHALHRAIQPTPHAACGSA